MTICLEIIPHTKFFAVAILSFATYLNTFPLPTLCFGAAEHDECDKEPQCQATNYDVKEDPTHKVCHLLEFLDICGSVVVPCFVAFINSGKEGG